MKIFTLLLFFLYEGLFKIVVEIVGYFLHEVNAAFTHYIMLGAWIDEVVNWNVVGYAYIEEIEWMLIEHYIVDEALTDEEFTFEVGGLVH